MVRSGDGDREDASPPVPRTIDEHEKILRLQGDRGENSLKVEEKGFREEEFDEISPEEDSDSGTPISWSGDSDNTSLESMIRSEEKLVCPLSHLPQPEKPIGMSKLVAMERSLSEGANGGSVDVSAIKKYIRDRGSFLTSALSRRISSFKETESVSEFHLNGLKVTVLPKGEENPQGMEISGRICFFSRSNCRDCTAVRSFFRQKNLSFVEINIDVFPQREKELIERTGTASVPQIFFNEKLLGGLVVLNSLRNSGEFDKRLRDMAGCQCPDSAPRPPLYGFEDEDEEKDRPDAMINIVRILRRSLPIQDRLSKMKIVKNCFSGGDLVEAVIDHLDCGRKRAVEIGKELCRKHFIHHVSREKDFEDGNQLYRLLEHDPTIARCFNFRKSTNDGEPKHALIVGRRLAKLMSAILEAYASDDRRHLDYGGISASEEFRRYVNLVEDLQRVDLSVVSVDELMAFFLNLYNAMVIHAVIKIGRPEGVIDRRSFFGDFFYMVNGHPFSLTTIKNGILRSNRRQPYTLVKPFNSDDQRLQLVLPKVNPLIHFGLCNGTRSSPTVRFFSGQATEMELRNAAREFFHDGGLEVDLEKRTVHLTRIIKWYSTDFGDEKEILKWVVSYLDPTKAGLLTHLQRDGGPIHITYQDFDWGLNS